MKSTELNLKKFTTIAIQGLVITVVASSLVLLFTSSGETLHLLKNNISWPLVPLLAIPVLLSWTCNGVRFWLMSRCIGTPLPLRRAWAIAVSSEFGVAASPGGVGGTAVRLGFLKKSGISFVHGGSLLAADVFLDILFFACIMPFALYALLQYLTLDSAAFSNDWNPAWLLMFLLPVGLFLFRKIIFRSLEKQPYFKQKRLGGRLRLMRGKLTHGFRQGRTATRLIFQDHRGVLVLNFLLTAVQFTARYSVLPFAILLLGIPVNPLPLIVMQGALYLISMVAVAPGGGGSVEVLAAVALPQLMPANLVGVAILLWRLFTYHFYLLFGGVVFARTFKTLMRN
ncbi:lysylphosphatidylglycerol synthase transmembrane domain-containing protein [Pontiellaceae bacterium B1224]|nr:lysylphosphatidylglycerol synthase transmembrane domain-containing protein [Pontiellaceae bacterium B1224]